MLSCFHPANNTDVSIFISAGMLVIPAVSRALKHVRILAVSP